MTDTEVQDMINAGGPWVDDRVERVARALVTAREEYFGTPPDYSPERLDLFRAYARAAIAAADAWRPIETAPTNGRFLFYSDRGDIDTGDMLNGKCCCEYMHGFGVATHWMPLPTPPEAK